MTKELKMKAWMATGLVYIICFIGPCFVQAQETGQDPDTSDLLNKIAHLEHQNKLLAQEKQNLAKQLEDNNITPQAYVPDFSQGDQSDVLFNMSIEELMDVEISSASLTQTTRRKTPSAVTTITQEDIQHSGARSLFELLEIYVPNFHWMFQGTKPRHMGLRGINDARDDKYLLLVNGRQMNEKTDFGVFSERDLPMLRDIQRIEVVRGPGSALYGPGALAMVINLIIDDPSTFEGQEVTVRGGLIEKYYSTEFKWGKMFSENQGLLIYGGGTHYPGAAGKDSQIRFAAGRATKFGTRYYVDDYYSGPMENYNAAYRGFPKLKFHIHYMHDNFNVWARYTQGGEYVDQSEWGDLEAGLVPRDIAYGVGYRQATITADYKQELSKDLDLTYRVSYDRTQIESTPYGLARELLYREDEYMGRVMARWTPSDNHKIAFGGEWTHEEFGLAPDGHDTTLNYRLGDKVPMPRWGTDMKSLVGEYQWGINEKLTAFFSGRLDDHSYVKTMFSPRAALVYTPNDKSTWKFMATESSRTNVAEDMKIDNLNGIENSEYETLKAVEVRYERHQSDRLWWAVSGFMHDHDMVSWSLSEFKMAPVGSFKSYGLELEGQYHADNYRAIFSHSFTKLNNVTFAEGTTTTELTASPNGYGTDFANWPNHMSKLNVEYDVSDKLLWTNSMVVVWGYPGGLDYAWYIDSLDDTRFDAKGSDAFDPSFFWNMGLEYKHSENTTFRVDAYNILGWFEKDAGKRKFGFTPWIPAMYRVQPSSFGFQMIHKF